MPVGAAKAALLGAAGAGAAGAQIRVVSFVKQDTVGTQTVSWTPDSRWAAGTVPKAVIFVASGANDAAGTFVSRISQCYGITSGPGESYAVTSVSRDGVTTSIAASGIADKALVLVNDGGSGATWAADLDSFGPDEFTLDWTTNGTNNNTGAVVIVAIVIGGDDVEAKAVTWGSGTGGTGNVSYSGLTFQPDLVLHATADKNETDGLPAYQATASIGLGAMDAAGNEWAIACGAEDAVGTSQTSRYQRTDKCIVDYSSQGPAVREEAQFVSMNADGWTVNYTTASGVNSFRVISLALAGVDAAVGSFLTSGSGDTPETGFGFSPVALLAASIANSTLSSIQNHDNLSAGAYDGTDYRDVGHVDVDNVGTTQADCVWDNDALINSLAGGPAVQHQITVPSFDADGFTWNKSAAGNEHYVHYIGLAAVA